MSKTGKPKNDHKVESTEYSCKNRAYWYISPKIVLTFDMLIGKLKNLYSKGMIMWIVNCPNILY